VAAHSLASFSLPLARGILTMSSWLSVLFRHSCLPKRQAKTTARTVVPSLFSTLFMVKEEKTRRSVN